MATIKELMKESEIEKARAEARAEERAYLILLLGEIRVERPTLELLQAASPSKYVN